VNDELRLLARVQQLEPEALSEAHETYYPAIYRYVAYKVGDQDVAEDLTSEVFTRLISAVRERSAPKKTLRGWLFAVASRVIADHHRRYYRDREIQEMPVLVEEMPNPSDTVSHRQKLRDLSKALKLLTDDQQEVISLRFGYSMPIREVAKTLGKSEGAVKQLQARAVAALSKHLAAWRDRA
jgi:RNA polymerase sigma-70 factor (ECF subfamily)